MKNSVYPKNHITERKIVEKGKLKTTNFSGDGAGNRENTEKGRSRYPGR